MTPNSAACNLFQKHLSDAHSLLHHNNRQKPALHPWAFPPQAPTSAAPTHSSPLLSLWRQTLAVAQPADENAQILWTTERRVYSTAHLYRLRHSRRLALLENDPVSVPLHGKTPSLTLLPFTTSETPTADVLLTGSDASLTFRDLHLAPALLSALSAMALTQPSPIQLQTIPRARLGVDVIAHAKSGTGKTIAYALVALDALLGSHRAATSGPVRTLVVVPTRELATQVVGVFQQLSACVGHSVHILALVGGLPLRTDERVIAERTPDVVVGTPGRVAALATSAVLSLEAVTVLVLDEADRLLEPSFHEDVRRICDIVPNGRQTMAFSATFPPWLRRTLQHIMQSPQYITGAVVDGGETPNDVDKSDVAKETVLLGVRQCKLGVHPRGKDGRAAPSSLFRLNTKLQALTEVLKSEAFALCIVFTNSKKQAATVETNVRRSGFSSRCINASLKQSDRVAVMNVVRDGGVRVVVATDLLARGVDIDTCDLVIHLDVPGDVATYLHRVGRAGRFGGQGCSVVIYEVEDEAHVIRVIEEKIGSALHPLKVTLPSLCANEAVVKVISDSPVAYLSKDASVKKKRKVMASPLPISSTRVIINASKEDGAGGLDQAGMIVAVPNSLSLEKNEGAIENEIKNVPMECKDAKPVRVLNDVHDVEAYAPVLDEVMIESNGAASSSTDDTVAKKGKTTEDDNLALNYSREQAPVLHGNDDEWMEYARKARQQGYEEAYARAFQLAFEMRKRLLQ